MDEWVGQVYETAVEPDTIDELLMTWSRQLHASKEADPEELTPHLVRAEQILGMQERLDVLETSSTPLEGTWPAFVLNASGTVAMANDQAESTYGIRAGSRVADLPFDRNMIEQLTRIISRQPERQVIGGYRDDNGRLVGLSVRPRPDQQFLVKTTDATWRERLGEDLKSVFGLTDAELGVVRGLLHGHTVAEIAEQRNAKLPTVRSQVRAIYDKTNAKSQPELLRLVIGLAELGSEEDDASDKDSNDPHVRAIAPERSQFHTVTLASGQVIEWADFGVSAGEPVVFVHDTFYGVQWPRRLLELVEAKGLRILAPCRPGYGNSPLATPAPGTVDEVVAGHLAWLDNLAIERAVFVARTNGVQYALALAAAQPERVAAVVGLAPALPEFKKGRFREDSFHAGSRRFADYASDAMLDFVGRVSQRYIRRKGLREAIRYYYQSAPADVRVIDDDAAFEAMSAGSAFARRHRHLATTHDIQRLKHPSVDHYVSCSAPITFLVGGEEANNRAERCARLIERGAPIKLTLVDHAGELFFYTHETLIADAIHQAVAKSAPLGS